MGYTHIHMYIHIYIYIIYIYIYIYTRCSGVSGTFVNTTTCILTPVWKPVTYR